MHYIFQWRVYGESLHSKQWKHLWNIEWKLPFDLDTDFTFTNARQLCRLSVNERYLLFIQNFSITWGNIAPFDNETCKPFIVTSEQMIQNLNFASKSRDSYKFTSCGRVNWKTSTKRTLCLSDFSLCSLFE